MPTKETLRVSEHRKRYFDRLSILIDQGGKWLIRSLAIREGVTGAELIRRAIVARAGLRMLPYKQDLDKLAEVHTQEEADKAIRALQEKEETNELQRRVAGIISPEPDKARYTVEIDHETVEALTRCITRADLTGEDVARLRRMLSNIRIHSE